ncbi:hypothetical protein PR048_031140 [Dryococelus australis]|uniref:Uncharacterized protein n=1 Tax=Dryococelus australis TaxID=614101 RepID=A0ABQ9G4E3_9NEOP|nr:hypothetical protein PR048_031140 [Dryococelus australis]
MASPVTYKQIWLPPVACKPMANEKIKMAVSGGDEVSRLLESNRANCQCVRLVVERVRRRLARCCPRRPARHANEESEEVGPVADQRQGRLRRVSRQVLMNNPSFHDGFLSPGTRSLCICIPTLQGKSGPTLLTWILCVSYLYFGKFVLLEAEKLLSPLHTGASAVCSLAVAPQPGSYGIRKVFSCKSAIGSKACRAVLINYDPIQKVTSLCATVAEWLDCSPPTKTNQVPSPAGSLPDIRKWGSYQTYDPGISRFPLPCIPALLRSRLASLSHRLLRPRCQEPPKSLSISHVPL